MDAVLPVMIAVMFAEMGSKTQTLTHAAATARNAAMPVLIALAMTSLVMMGIGAAGGQIGRAHV